MIKINTLSILLCTMALAACSKLSGTYVAVAPHEAEGMMSLEFQSGSKAILSVSGTQTEVSYSVDGNKIKLAANGSNQLFELQDDGSIATGSAIFGKLVLKKK